MAAPHGAIRNWAEYLVVRAVAGTVGRAPASVSLGLARGISRLACGLLRGRRRRASERIVTCLGLRSGDARVKAILRGAYQCLALNAVEPMLVERLLDAGRPPPEIVRIEGQEHLSGAFASGRPVLICSGHIGAWESVPVLLARLHQPIWAMARPLTNPLIERYLAERRLRCVRGTVSKDGGGLKFARIMRAGEPLGLLLDQNAGSKGVILDFLGLPASHHTVAGVMAQRFGAQVLPLYLIREPQPLRFRMIVEPAITADPALPAEKAELDVVERLTRSMERIVRAHPDQWLWLHDRWRHALHVLGGRTALPDRSEAEHTQVAVAQGTNGG